MQIATLDYLGYKVQVEIPNPSHSRDLYVYISDRAGYLLQHFSYTAVNENPDLWVVEAITLALKELPFSLTLAEKP